MTIVHRVTFGYDKKVANALDGLGINYKRAGRQLPTSRGIVSFDIEETDPRWPAVKALLDARNKHTLCRTKFTRAELRSAAWLWLGAWEQGYPMPDSDFGYLDITYDLTDYCEKCGVGAVQKAPFRMRGEPKWGTKSIMHLNWVFDEIFVVPGIWELVFKPLGVDCWPVLHHRTGKSLDTVLQLRVDTVLEHEFDMQDHPYQVCSACSRKKYLPFSRGMFPKTTGPVPRLHAVKTQEWFGDGARAFRAFLVSQSVFTRFYAMNLKKAVFKPLEQ